MSAHQNRKYILTATWRRAAVSLLGFRPGITATLAISFSAVAILAAAANLIVEQGISVVRTTRFESTTPPPITPMLAPAAIPAPAAMPRPNVPSLSSDLLMLMLDRFEHAAQARAELNSTQTAAQFKDAGKQLEGAAADFIAQADPHASSPKLPIAIKTYKRHAEELVRITDARRTAFSDYWSRIEAMNIRVKVSLDGALKIFGRVLARQSLIQMRANLDEIRRRFADIGSAESYERGAVDALASSEAAFATTFEQNRKGLARSEGEQWVLQMHDDFLHTVALRETIVELDTQYHKEAQQFSEEGAKLTGAVAKRVAARTAELESQTRAASVRIPQPAISQKAPDISKVTATSIGNAATLASTPAPARSVTTMTTAPKDSHRRAVIAWITAGVLLLLTGISAFTVRSILRPVRRMLEATAQLAKGEIGTRVPRGGIKELDTLGVAFNEMAEQLAAARQTTQDHQRELEEKVEERTRQLQQLAERDPLTLLPNRRQLFVLLNAAIGRAAQNQRFVGIFFLDIDNFKNLNDSMGHAFGDRVLVGIAQRLVDTAQAFGFAARLGGDEFTVVYQDAPSVEAISEAGIELVNAFYAPITIDDRELIVSVSVGASVYPDHEQEAEMLLRAADTALFRAKALGRSQLAVFTPELLQAAAAKFTIEQGLRRALERGEFELVFQPEVSLDNLEVGLVEALIRWRLPDRRLAIPGEFLAVAEESGLILQISDWVLRAAIETAARWHHGVWPQARVAINVSPRQLLDHRFVERLQDLLQEFRLPARCIEIELTETVLQTGPSTIEALRRLRAHGVAIALDDFGTGYSSLTSLEQLPLTRIKLDRSLIASIDTSARSAAIARAIISLCHSLGLEITAEGIERPEQFACLLGNHAMYLQGYLLSQPVSGDELLPVMAAITQKAQDILLSLPAKSYSSDVVEIASIARKASKPSRL